MKRLNRAYIKGTNWALSGLLSLLGFSCDNGGGMAEYGTPMATYTVKGKVVTDKGTAISQLQVIVPSEEYVPHSDTLTTNAQGEFTLNNTIFPPASDLTLKIMTTDIDGAANGGNFAPDTSSVTIKREDLKDGDGHWYVGHAEKKITITLKEKKTE